MDKKKWIETSVMISLLLISVLTFAASVRPITASGNLVGHWKFDEGTGTTAYDDSGNNNNGAIHGGAWVSGKIGNALHFDPATDDYVRVEDSPSLEFSDSITVMSWVNVEGPNSCGSHEVICAKWYTDGGYPTESFTLEFQPDGRTPQFVVKNSTGIKGCAVSDLMTAFGEWTHIAGTYDGVAVRIYVNGVLTGSVPLSGPMTIGDQPLMIGKHTPWIPTSWVLNGTIDDVRVYNEALSVDEILTIIGTGVHDVAVTDIMPSKTVLGQGYSSRVNVTVANQGGSAETFNVTLSSLGAEPERGLAGYWKFDEGTGTIAHDSSGSGNDGILNGPTWIDGRINKALSFDGVDDYVEISCSTSLNISGPIEISAWIKAGRQTAPPGQLKIGEIVEKGDGFVPNAGYALRISDYEPLYPPQAGPNEAGHANVVFNLAKWPTFPEYSRHINSWTRVDDENWHFIKATYDGSAMRMYLDDVLETAFTVSSPIYTNDLSLRIGGGHGGRFFNGSIDEVRIRALSDGPVGYWKLDEGSGTTTYDSSGNENDGTINGAIYVDGKIGKALDFDGVDDNVQVLDSSSLDLTNALTIAMWFKPEKNIHPGFSDYYILQDKWHGTGDQWRTGYGLTLNMYSFGKLGLLMGFGNSDWNFPMSTKDTWSAGEWYHVTVTYDSSLPYRNVKFYVDGSLDSEHNETRPLAPNTLPFYINIDPFELWHPGNTYFPGVIDDVKVYNRALGQEEIRALAFGATIQEQTVTLESGGSTTLTFTWDATSFTKGNYTLSAYAWPVPGETDTSDNTFVDGWVFVSIPGDINADKKVDLKDVFAVGNAFGSDRNGTMFWHGSPPGKICCPHSPNCNINDDDKIDLKDYFIVCKHYGETDP